MYTAGAIDYVHVYINEFIHGYTKQIHIQYIWDSDPEQRNEKIMTSIQDTAVTTQSDTWLKIMTIQK